LRRSVSNPTTITSKENEDKLIRNEKDLYPSSTYLLDRNIEIVTAGLRIRRELSNGLHGISAENALTISEYIMIMKTEINPSDNYRRDNIKLLIRFSMFHHNKAFKQIIRNDVLSFLESLRKPEASDPLHKWIGTYNLFRMYLLRFFKWLYYPETEPSKRPRPAMTGNKQYAEVLVNGKAGSRHIPLIDSIPYLKDYLGHEHPQPGNPSSILICGNGKSFARPLDT
jgi:hypothetical protein